MRGLAAPRASSALSPPGAVLCCALLGWVGLCWAAAAAAAPQGPAAPAARPGRRGAGRVPPGGGGHAVVLREGVCSGAAVGLCFSAVRSRSSAPTWSACPRQASAFIVSVPSVR